MMKRLLLLLAACGDGVHGVHPDAAIADAPPDAFFMPDAAPLPRLCGDGLRAPHELCAQLMTFAAPGVRAAHLVGDRIVYLDATGIKTVGGPDGPLVDATRLAIGDLDHDGITDLVTAGDTLISAWRGTGTGYVAAGTYVAGGAITGMGVGNTDGLPGDEVVVIAGNQYAILTGALAPFAQRQTLALTDLVVADADGDGYADGLGLYQDASGSQGTAVLSGPIGIRGESGLYALGPDGASLFDARLAAIVAGDVDGDGTPEMLLGAVEPADITAYDDASGYRDIQGGGAIPRVQLLAVGRLGASDHTDLVMSSHDPEQLTVIYGVDNHNLWTSMAVAASFALPGAITGLTVDGDYNGDGRQDPVVVLPDQIGVLVSQPY